MLPDQPQAKPLRRVQAIARAAAQQLRKTAAHPSRLLALFDADRRRVVREETLQRPWDTMAQARLSTRRFRTYAAYLRNQRSKPHGIVAATDHDARFHAALLDRLEHESGVRHGMSVLCLGARWGTEVRAFRDLGCFAVGIDLKPGAGVEYVLQGDFQHLLFPDACVDVVFSNSLDHAFDIDVVLAEACRVLKPKGYLIVEAVRGSEEGHAPGAWEAFYWATVSDLQALIESRGFHLRARQPISEPWAGEHLSFLKSPQPPPA